MLYDVQKLKYIILPGKFPTNPNFQKLHNDAFLYWKNFWNNIFYQNGVTETVNADNFWRQDRITLLINETEIVGQHLYSMFHLSSLAAKYHSYMVNSFSEDYFQKLKDRNAMNVMSMEYFSVSQNWRKKNCGISLASVMIGLACEHQKLYQIDALIGPSRSDNKVTNLVTDFGGDILVGGLTMHNTPVDLIAIFADKSKIHPDLNVNVLIKSLWNQKLDLTQALPLERKRSVA